MLSRSRFIFRLFSSNPWFYLDVKYTTDHEWVSYNPQSKSIKIGITNFAKDSLGEIVYVEFKSPNVEVKKGQEIMTLESVKAVGKVNSPVDGKVIAQNDKVAANQEEEFTNT